MKKWLAAPALLLALLVLYVLIPRAQDREARPVEGLPWQIELLPNGGSRVFGLTLGQSTLADARARFGADMEMAVIAGKDEPGALEAYFAHVSAGVVTGKLILVGDADPQTVARLRERAVKTEIAASGARKFLLDRADLAAAFQAPIRAITFIPSVNLDADTVRARFGAPAERIRTDEHSEHFLYPDKGLDVLLEAKGKEVLQYVAPRDFARLRAPLLNAGEK
jgi:hypothetical protein